MLEMTHSYIDSCRIYRNCVRQNEGVKGEAVVLDMFAGVGTGLIALKRLGIAIKTVSFGREQVSYLNNFR